MPVRYFVAFLSVALLVSGCMTEETVFARDGVQVYQRLSVIGTSAYSLRIGGVLYDNLTSGFYVSVPEKNLVCFTTVDLIGGSTYLHVVSTGDQGRAFKIRLGPEISGFSSALGSKQTDPGSTYVDHVIGESIYFTEKISSGIIGHYRLDLEKQTLTKIEK